jgi:capsular polysaccharide biosynthesis protein
LHENVFDYSVADFLDLSGGAEFIDSPVVYLGWFTGHYGHFIMETVSRLWALDYFSAHFLNESLFYFDVPPGFEKTLSKEWVTRLLAAFGLSSKNIIFGTRRYEFRQMVVPSQAICLHKSVDGFHQSKVWHRLAESLRLVSAGYGSDNPLIYLSRSDLEKDKRRLTNEKNLEIELQKIGFQVVHPEKLSLDEQVSIYMSADLVVGPSGSALHNAAFMKEGTVLVSLTTRDFCLLNELLCAYAMNIDYKIFVCNGEAKSGWTVPVESLTEYLVDLISTLGFEAK